uniref:Pectinesterase n=1 Tax=Kalanchoe fedtschenkoi TaxID=63787 RepID=A0A7N0VMZ2_KALFE
MHCTSVISLPWLLLVCTYFSGSWSLDCKPIARTIIVDQSGGGDYKTIQAALDTIPDYNDQWTKVHIRPGTYLEKIKIFPVKGCIFLEGDGRDKTIISWDDHSSTDAVAAAVGGDKQAFYDCGFSGYQDTLWDQAGRHYFSECYIEGAVDFIFGYAQSFYEKCTINVTGYGYITAQGRSKPDETNGYVFEQCNVVGTGPTYLGRAYGAYSRVIYHSCTIDADIVPQGWDPWFQAGHEENLYYVESDCKGAHYDTSKRVKWLKKLDNNQLEDFTRDKFINQDGWIEKQPV